MVAQGTPGARQEASGVTSALLHRRCFHPDVDARLSSFFATSPERTSQGKGEGAEVPSANFLSDTDGPLSFCCDGTSPCHSDVWSNATRPPQFSRPSCFRFRIYYPTGRKVGMRFLTGGPPHPRLGRVVPCRVGPGRYRGANGRGNKQRANILVELPPLEREPWCPAQGGGQCPERG